METPKFYPEWYNLFVDRTNEKSKLVEKVKELLIDIPHESCLEIGLGVSPYFAKHLTQFVNRYSIVEKRIVDTPLPEGAELINQDWETYNPDKKFDIILASHVIYYFQNLSNAINKMFESLNDNGRIIFVVNGKENDYGKLKRSFSRLMGENHVFTYDRLMSHLHGYKTIEHIVPSQIIFFSPEELFETLRISFDHCPEQYNEKKPAVISYIRQNLSGRKFNIDQKIIEAVK